MKTNVQKDPKATAGAGIPALRHFCMITSLMSTCFKIGIINESPI